MSAALLLASLLMSPASASPLDPAYAAFSTAAIQAHVAALASDEFEGRLPGTKGEELTAAYLEGQFRKLGLEPAGPGSGYTQKVPLLGISGQPKAAFLKGSERIELEHPKDYVAVTRRAAAQLQVPPTDVVFVGYGIVAPEYHWDDYKGLDVKGKVLLMLVGDPPIPDRKDPSKLDEKLFKGKALTYYGRWTYKYEIATKKGAAACILIHETAPAGYPWEVVMNSWSRENFDLRAADGNAGRVAVEAWISSSTAARVLKAAGPDLARLKKAALSRNFRPLPLGLKASFDLSNTLRPVDSRNFVAKLTGSDPKLKDEYVVYSAHWDHFGKDPKLEGRQVYSGALDNASGVAAVLELARGFAALPQRPKRSLLFFFPTAEEQGLLGSKHYAAHPLFPIKKTAAAVNIDGLNAWGRTRDLMSIGYGQTTLDDLAEAALKEQGRRLTPDQDPEKGYYFRSDHFEFAKVGVPAFDYGKGLDYVGRPEGWGKEKQDDYTAHHYHKVTDQVRDDWDWTGALEDLQLLLRLGWEAAQSEKAPEWKPGSEFKSLR